MKARWFILWLALAISGCSSYYSTNGEKKYPGSRNGPDLVVPRPLTSENISYFYKLPPQTQNPAVAITPPNL